MRTVFPLQVLYFRALSTKEDTLCSDIPGQEFVDPVDLVIGDAADDIAQISLRVYAVQLCRFGQRVNDGRTFPAEIGTGEQPVLAAEG